MKILVVAATAGEVAAVRQWATSSAPAGGDAGAGGREIDVLVTGVGMVATAAWCSRALAERRVDLALNLGLCGSFDPALGIGQVVHVVEDRFAELGAEDGERFIPLDELPLIDGPAPLEARPAVVNPAPPRNAALEALPRARGITVNTVHGHERSIAAVIERCHPQVETMEGAAFMYACLIHGVPFAQVRAVSNIVERRNREAWRIPQAVEQLAAAAIAILEAA
jgi:futalosine hydrolase